jgi:hypothetical protein
MNYKNKQDPGSVRSSQKPAADHLKFIANFKWIPEHYFILIRFLFVIRSDLT